MQDPGHLVIEDGLRVRLRTHARARRMTLRVSSRDGSVSLTVPAGASVAEARRFAESRREWLRQALSRLGEPQIVAPGVSFPVAGEMLTLRPAPLRACRVEGQSLLVPQQGPTGAALRVFLRHRAHQALSRSVTRYAGMIGRQPRALVLRDTRSRWGSCSVDGRLMFSWRLAMAPPEVLDYVAAHEVAHLRHMDHSSAFWDAVAELMADHAPRRDWLRNHGHRLMAWRFAPLEPGSA